MEDINFALIFWNLLEKKRPALSGGYDNEVWEGGILLPHFLGSKEKKSSFHPLDEISAKCLGLWAQRCDVLQVTKAWALDPA